MQEEPPGKALLTFGVYHEPHRIPGAVVRLSKDNILPTSSIIMLVGGSDLLSERPKLPASDPLRACRGSDECRVGALKDLEEIFGLTY